ncbi:beta-1,6-N-acetylglucosaminyltransferase [Mobilicoccus pelagius]|uniref:Peptide O-xylosyltransferase n=1 Tax=Mobilicoccus pelagius NBRC 104925 TaxID=1089455 RepID=H5UQV1_9MICO|nr:beta-1,6-N-acetylglucosaminyltransferase [Mobilicoccus pelagius]GAB48109.1 hypothetical protein MOPEL_060_00250 [Mobilicoccus pelagius NBRC 104925]
MTTPLAVVVLAHDRPQHLHRLVDALHPFPIFLHVDASVPDARHAELVSDLPERVRLLPRVRTEWAGVGLVVAELLGYRAALEETDASHIAVLSGSDYPLHDADGLTARLAHAGDRSLVAFHDLPYDRWGPMRGYDRFVFVNRPWRRHRLFLPLPRPWPRGIHPAGGSALKVLSRTHAERVVTVVAERPDIRRYFTGVWIPDETLVPSVLTSPEFSPYWDEEVADVPQPWFIDWSQAPTQSPEWLIDDHFDAIARAARRPDGPLFARKFGDGSDALLDRIDVELRGRR